MKLYGESLRRLASIDFWVSFFIRVYGKGEWYVMLFDAH